MKIRKGIGIIIVLVILIGLIIFISTKELVILIFEQKVKEYGLMKEH